MRRLTLELVRAAIAEATSAPLPKSFVVETDSEIGVAFEDGVALTKEQFLVMLDRLGASQEEIDWFVFQCESIANIVKSGEEACCYLCGATHDDVKALAVTLEGQPICTNCMEEDEA